MKFLKPPLKELYINQDFGQDNACIYPDSRVVGKVFGVCPIGSRSLYSFMKGHNGIDYRAYHGQPVNAMHDGIVIEIVDEDARGKGIGIVSDLAYELEGYGIHQIKSRYWHLWNYFVKVGDKIKAGQTIALADNTGYSSGTHLHTEVKPVEQDSSGEWRNSYQSNGYFGAIDFKPYLKVIETFNRNLWYGTWGDDVRRLQEWLNNNGYLVAQTGWGSKGRETRFFGKLTREAVKKFQAANNIKPVAGYFGFWTRSVLNEKL